MNAEKNQRNGFTLIELLVVIAVIGILATLFLVSLNSAKAKARDAKRKHDLRQIRLAIEIYYDNHGYYPTVSNAAINPGSHGGAWCHNRWTFGDCWSSSNPAISTLEKALRDDGLLSKLPKDPIDNCFPTNVYGAFMDWDHRYCYVYVYEDQPAIPGQPQKYTLFTTLENTNDPDRCQNKCYTIPDISNFDGRGHSFCSGVMGGVPTCPNYYDHDRHDDPQNYIFSANQ